MQEKYKKNCLIVISLYNMTDFRPDSRQQQDRFKNMLLEGFFWWLLACVLCVLFWHVFANFFAAFLADFFWTAFWRAFLSTRYKSLPILSMQYKSLLHVFRGWGGVGWV